MIRHHLARLVCLLRGHRWSEWRPLGIKQARGCARCGRFEIK